MTNRQLRELYAALPAAEKALCQAWFYAGWHAHESTAALNGCTDARAIAIPASEAREFFTRKYGTGVTDGRRLDKNAD